MDTRAPVPPRPASPVPAPAADRPWDRLLLVAAVLQAAAVAAWPLVVTVDGSAHLAGADALLEAGSGVHALYLVDWTPVPNMLTTVVLAGLLPVVGPETAERLLVLAWALGLPLAARYALRGVHPRAGWLALGAVPFVGGYLYAYGFYNFCLGLVGFLLVVGLALRRGAGWSAGSAAALAALLLLTWSAHLLPAVVAGAAVAAVAASRALAARAAGWRGALVRHVVPPGLAGLPAAALTLSFAVASAETRGEPVRTSSLAGLVGGLVTLGRPLVAWVTWEYAGSVLVAVGLVALAALRGRRLDAAPERAGLAVAGVALTVWYLLSPDRYGDDYGFLNDRLSLFPPLFLLLWSAGPPPARRAGRVALALLLTGAVALVGARLPTEWRYQRDVAELLSVADEVPRGSTLVALRLERDAPVGPDARNRARDPLRHAPGEIAVRRDAVNVGHYEAVTPYFPVRFRPETDPRRAIDPDLEGLEEVPPRVDLTHGPEVVLLVGRGRAAPDVLAGPEAQSLLARLEAGYRRVATSEPTGLVEVWHREEPGSS